MGNAGNEKQADQKKRRPTRLDLLAVISRLQDLIGKASGDHGNDRDRDGFEKGQRALGEAHNLCIEARAFDPPSAGRRSKFLKTVSRG